MSSPTRGKRALASLFLIFTLVMIPFGIAYYTSTDFYKQRFQQWRQNNERASQPSPTGKIADQFILAKDEKLEINEICLEFKGVQEKNYLFNLYLLDFDRQQSFPMQVSKKEAKEPFTFGGHRFTILTGNDRFIKLKLIDRYQTP